MIPLQRQQDSELCWYLLDAQTCSICSICLLSLKSQFYFTLGNWWWAHRTIAFITSSVHKNHHWISVGRYFALVYKRSYKSRKIKMTQNHNKPIANQLAVCITTFPQANLFFQPGLSGALTNRTIPAWCLGNSKHGDWWCKNIESPESLLSL